MGTPLAGPERLPQLGAANAIGGYSRSVRGLSAAAAFAALALGVGQAQAYCRTTTCDPNTECEYDLRGCAIVGEPLAWKTGCVSYSVHRSGSPKRGVSYDTAHKLTETAFSRWAEADCRGSTPSIEVSDLSPALCSEPEYNSDHGNANVVMFRDNDWPYAGANATLALTTITFNPQNGEIFDADIEVNSFRTPLTTSDVGIEFDLQSILTHEAGHFLGLSHSHVESATMYLEYSEGSSLRELHSDDIAGICAVYPDDRDVSDPSCKPRHGYSPDCKPPPDDGCSLSGSPATRRRAPLSPLFVWLAVGLAALSARQQRRRAR